MAAGKVVGHGVLYVVDVRYPVVGADVGDVEEVEAVESDPYAFEVAPKTGAFGLALFWRGEEGVAQPDIHALICGSTEIAFVARGAGRGYWQAVGEDAAQ